MHVWVCIYIAMVSAVGVCVEVCGFVYIAIFKVVVCVGLCA